MAVRTLGIEEEFLLYHRSGPELVPVGEDVIRAVTAVSMGQFEHELKTAQAELGTAPTTRLADAEVQIRARRAELAATADDHGARIAASATSPVHGLAVTTDDHRYRAMDRLFGQVARLQLTCGMHVHVGIDSPDEGVAVIDRIQPWLPVLVALSASSPFWHGEDTRYDSYRSIVWGQWPTAGSTQPFGSVDAYRAACQDLIMAGAAMDAGMIYFAARLSEHYPTVEVRVADVCPLASDAITVAGLVRALVARAADDWAAGRPVAPVRAELRRAGLWRAARHGMRESLLDPVVGRPVPAWDVVHALLEYVSPVLREHGDEARVVEGLEAIRARGTGAALQRATLAAGSYADVVDAVAAATLE